LITAFVMSSVAISLMTNDKSHLRMMANQDGAAILDTTLGTISTLNPTGAFVWQALERGETVESIAANLARDTGEEIAALERDVREFIDALREQHLLPC
jgi:hypothetical protein